MQRRKFSREFKLEAVRLVRERGVALAHAARDLDVHENVLRKWVKEFAADPGHAFPGAWQMKPEPLEIDRLRREAPRDPAGGMDVRGAQKFLGGVSRSGFHGWPT